jgi:hypothetical protein
LDIWVATSHISVDTVRIDVKRVAKISGGLLDGRKLSFADVVVLHIAELGALFASFLGFSRS